MTRLLWFLSMVLVALPRVGAQQPADRAPAPAEPVTVEKSDAEAADIKPPDVYQRIGLVRAEIELLRLEMGKPEVSPPPIEVDGAAPREVFFQALTLFRKANRLGFEHTFEQVKGPQIPSGQIRPPNVYAVVDAALDRVISVKQNLGIPDQAKTPERQEAVEHSQVFLSILAANREINNLLDQQFSPSDVYLEVTLAIAHLSRLLDSPDHIATPPDAPPFERRKRPADVYRKLIDCFDEIHQIAADSGVTMLNITYDEEQIEDVEPSDVCDIAAILVSDLAHLRSLRKGTNRPRPVTNPGRKLPSDVYQRLGILSRQLEELKKVANADPDWLSE